MYPELEEALLALLEQRRHGRAGQAYVLREYARSAINRKFQDALQQFAARRT